MRDRYHLGMRIVEIRKFPDGWQAVKVRLGGSFVSYEWLTRYRAAK